MPHRPSVVLLLFQLLLAAVSAMRRPVAVISSTSRGIGLEFARQLLDRRGFGFVVGLQRSQSSSPPHPLLASHPGRFRIIDGVDLEQQETLASLHTRVKELLISSSTSGGDDAPPSIDLLINASALLGDGGVTSPGPERSIAKIDRSFLQKTFDINLFGHIMVTEQLLPLLKQGTSPQSPSRVVNMSARVGSISDNNLGGWYSYRMSKAALNQFTRTLSVEVKRNHVSVLSMHPGTTDTDLSKPFQKNVRPDKLFSVDKSVSMMLDVILGSGIKETGKFLAYDGQEIPY